MPAPHWKTKEENFQTQLQASLMHQPAKSDSEDFDDVSFMDRHDQRDRLFQTSSSVTPESWFQGPNKSWQNRLWELSQNSWDHSQSPHHFSDLVPPNMFHTSHPSDLCRALEASSFHGNRVQISQSLLDEKSFCSITAATRETSRFGRCRTTHTHTLFKHMC